MSNFVPCLTSGCNQPGEVTARFVVNSKTDGPIEYITVHCVAGHWVARPVYCLEELE